MKTADRPGKSILGLSYASAVLSALVVAALALASERQERDAFRQGARVEAQDRLNLLRSEVQRAVDANIHLANGLVAMLGYAPDIDQAGFSLLAEKLLGAQTGASAITLAPDFVIGMAHPPEANRAAIGHDFRGTAAAPGLRAAAPPGASMTFEGPTALPSGGTGFAVRAPVFHDDAGGGRRPWGIVSVEIDAEALYRAAGLRAPDLGLDVALTGRDGRAEAGEVFLGEVAILAREPVLARVALPRGTWSIAATPAGGWPAPPVPWGHRGLFALAALLVAGPILGIARVIASGQTKLATIRAREAELSQLSWRLEFALTASNVGVWDVDLETDELLWDARARELFGCADRTGPFGEADWAGVLHPDDRARTLAQAAEAITGNGRFVAEYRIVRPDGAVRQMRDMAAVFHDIDGRSRLVGLVWDITADVERQEELNLRRLEAEAATVAKSRFLATMSHEIRTPISGVLGLLGLIMDEPLTAQQRERAQIALTSARSLLDILNDILDFSKLEANQMRLRDQDVPLRSLLREVVDLMAAVAAQKGLSLALEIAPEAPEAVVTDPLLLRQVLTNLVSNATKFTPTGGAVTVRVDYARDPEGGRLCVEVRDTGIGVPAEARERIFDDFVQADDTLSRGVGGTGLGLAISRRLVELMGGGIGVQSRPGEGSAFSFWVRAPEAAAALTRPQRAAPAPPASPTGAQRSLRVLVADDNATNRYLIEAFLRRDGHDLVMVESGSDAIEAVRSQAFDVVLMDVQMPRVDGLAATRAIRALPGPAARVPIVALTANALSGDRETCLAAGMDDYLAKPIEPDALRAALGRNCVLRTAARSASG